MNSILQQFGVEGPSPLQELEKEAHEAGQISSIYINHLGHNYYRKSKMQRYYILKKGM